MVERKLDRIPSLRDVLFFVNKFSTRSEKRSYHRIAAGMDGVDDGKSDVTVICGREIEHSVGVRIAFEDGRNKLELLMMNGFVEDRDHVGPCYSRRSSSRNQSFSDSTGLIFVFFHDCDGEGVKDDGRAFTRQ